MRVVVEVFLLIAVVAVAACGRIGFDACRLGCGSGGSGGSGGSSQPPTSCTLDGDCPSGHCVANVCCNLACTGTCNACTTGTCTAVPAACTAPGATCSATADGFTCATSGGCSTATAPNLAGSCASGPTAMLGDGCEFHYDYSSYVMASNFVEYNWDYERCQAGAWVTIDASSDAFPCTGCAHETRNTWTDTCGNLTMFTQVCP